MREAIKKAVEMKCIDSKKQTNMTYKEELNKLIIRTKKNFYSLETLLFLLDGGAWTGNKTVSNTMELYSVHIKDIVCSFDEFEQKFGNEIIEKPKDENYFSTFNMMGE